MFAHRRPRTIAALLAATALTACSHQRPLIVRSVGDLAPADQPGAVLEMRDGSQLRGQMVAGGGTTLLFQVQNELLPRRVAVGEVDAISVPRPVRGTIEGLALGGVGGAMAGALLGVMTPAKDEECTGACTRGERAVRWGLFGGLGGGAIGALIGYAVGSRDRFALTTPASKP